MDISIIIPVYNMSSYIGECMDSVIAQTIGSKEVICVDDGSMDGTVEIIRQYQKKYQYIRLIRQENQGSGAARNNGLKEATGKYIAYMDADDFYASNDALETLVEKANHNNADVCGGNIIKYINGKYEKIISDKCNFKEEKWVAFEKYQYIVGYTGFVFKRNFLEEHSVNFSLYKRSQDLHFMYKALHSAKKIWTVPKNIYVVRVIEKIQNFSEGQIYDLLEGINKILEWSYQDGYFELYRYFWETICKYVFCDFYPMVANSNKEKWDIIRRINENFHEDVCSLCSKHFRRPLIEDDEYEQYLKEKEQYFQELKEKVSVYANLYIYGAGSVGKRLWRILKKENIDVKGFVVTKKESEYIYEEKIIYEIEKVSNYKENSLILVGVMGKNKKEVLDVLHKFKFPYILEPDLDYLGISI